MKSYKTWIFSFTLVLLTQIVQSQPAPQHATDNATKLLQLLARANTIECTLSSGSNTHWSNQGQMTIQPAEFGKDGFFIVSGMNYDKRSAEVHWPDFSHEVTLIPMHTGISFVYIPDQRSIFTTTIFADTIGNSARLKVTHSRHIYLNGRARPSQYSGYCVVN